MVMPQLNYKQMLAGVVLVSAQSGFAFAADTNSTGVAADKSMTLSTSSAAVSVLEGDILSRPRMMQRGIGVRESLSVWKDGIVPYYIDPELQSYLEVNILAAVKTWNKVAGITLVKINPRDWDAPKDYLHFQPANGCASWVGRQGGAQAIWTGAGCSKGSMMHEIGHALGLEHEHTRPDRDQHISINWDNIDPIKTDNFDISKTDRTNFGPYDYASIMHYGEYFFSSNDEKTIVPLNIENAEIGQRDAPSAGDIKAISSLYKSDISLVSHVVTESAGSEVSLLITNEHFQGANMLELYMDVGSAQLLTNSNLDWDCFTFDTTLSCSRDRLAGAEQSSLVLSFDKVLNEADLNPSLGSKTPDNNMANNGGEFSPAAALGANQTGNTLLLADDQQQASMGAMGPSMGVIAIALTLRLMRRSKTRIG